MIKLKVAQILDERHLTTEQFAKLARINIATARNYRKDSIDRYDRDILERICAGLDVNLDDILERETD